MKIDVAKKPYFIQSFDIKNNSHLLNSLDEAILIVDKEGICIFVNNAFCRMERLERSDIIGKSLEEIYALESTFYEDAPLRKVLLTGMPQLGYVAKWYSCTGYLAYGGTNSYPIRDTSGNLVGGISVTYDVYDMETKLENYYQKTNNHINTFFKNNTHYTFDNIIHVSGIMEKTISLAKKFASNSMPLMITGETGTGKEMFAQSIHNQSYRKHDPFIAINCAAIPETLIESLLFGTAKGAFTGAVDTKGMFEKAGNGTIFLDEINSMPIQMQSKLLRVLQEKEAQRLGGNSYYKVNCRILSACNKPVDEILSNQELRKDLYYRLTAGFITIPPLRERREDIKLLADFYVKRMAHEMNLNISNISPDLINLFKQYDWPGNIRDLCNTLSNMLNMCSEDDTILEPRHMPDLIKKQLFKDSTGTIAQDFPAEQKNEPSDTDTSTLLNTSYHDAMAQFEKQFIEKILQSAHGNVTLAATYMKISRQALTTKLNKHLIPIEEYRK